MAWEKPEFVEVSLACEVSGYSNAELDVAQQESRHAETRNLAHEGSNLEQVGQVGR